MAALPEERPAYMNPRLSNYTYLDEVGRDERSDPYYFATTLVDAICKTPRQELGTHTMSHYYCFEDGQTLTAFEADLAAAKALADLRGVSLKSIVLPRNQFTAAHLDVCARQGITHYRGNPRGWAYRAAKGSEQTPAKRALRLIDAYSGVLGAQTFALGRDGLVDVPASRFLRPCAGKLATFHPLHMGAIKRGMTEAAKAGRGYDQQLRGAGGNARIGQAWRAHCLCYGGSGWAVFAGFAHVRTRAHGLARRRNRPCLVLPLVSELPRSAQGWLYAAARTLAPHQNLVRLDTQDDPGRQSQSGRPVVSELSRQRHRVSREIVARRRSTEPNAAMRYLACTF